MSLTNDQLKALELLVGTERCTQEELNKFTEQELQAIAMSTQE